MKNNSFQSIADGLLKYRRKILSAEKIREIIKKILQDEYTDSKMYKTFHYLKNRWYLLALKKSHYYVKKPEDEINEDEIIDDAYRSIIKDWIKKADIKKRYIGGLKALEIALGINSSIDEILIVTPEKQGLETPIAWKKIFFKTYGSQKKNLFPFFYKSTTVQKIHWINFHVANPELAILETLYRTSILQKNYWEELIKKWLKTHKRDFNTDQIEIYLRENKFNSSINTLANISEKISPELNKKLLNIIKKSWYIIN